MCSRRPSTTASRQCSRDIHGMGSRSFPQVAPPIARCRTRQRGLSGCDTLVGGLGNTPDDRARAGETAGSHDQEGLWPWPDDQGVDLNEADGPGGIDTAGRAARQRLLDGHDRVVIGHGDWLPDNLRWRGSQLLVAYDWDSLIA